MVSGKKGTTDVEGVKQKILEYFIKKHKSGSESVTTAEMSNKLNKNHKYVRDILHDMEKAELIEQIEKRKAEWRLTSSYVEKIQQAKE